MCTLDIFVGYAKFFYSNNDSTLIKRLSWFTAVLLDLLNSYLKHCEQQVYIQPHASKRRNLGPMLHKGGVRSHFFMYRNEVVSIDNSARFIIYAYWTTQFFTYRDECDAINDVNCALRTLLSWSIDNSLEVTAVETKAVSFRSKDRKKRMLRKDSIMKIHLLK